ncbi:hypothetical protein M595_3503 [Lyngbya aestuarii BL J]|uniref:Uncharacterized protein n=1 Tax=Lyngbya aestuarii BL J TaxID=1348334 RepID=U7QHH9_9CYAN|nr:hypothetical protein M595_3503 [Lyngbya aestuarii BL J]
MSDDESTGRWKRARVDGTQQEIISHDHLLGFAVHHRCIASLIILD